MEINKTGKQVFIIHGYGATPDNHWFPWLKEKLTADGAAADILELPAPLSPNLNEWLHYLSQHAAPLTKDTYLVAHSLGCVALLKHLLQITPKEQIGGLILVSGFTKSLPGLELLDEFTQEQLDYSQVIAMTTNRAVIASKDDSIVPYSFSKELAEEVDAALYPVESGGHFLDSDGFTELPVVYDVLRDMMN